MIVNYYCFKPLNFGVICYSATDSKYIMHLTKIKNNISFHSIFIHLKLFEFTLVAVPLYLKIIMFLSSPFFFSIWEPLQLELKPTIVRLLLYGSCPGQLQTEDPSSRSFPVVSAGNCLLCKGWRRDHVLKNDLIYQKV